MSSRKPRSSISSASSSTIAFNSETSSRPRRKWSQSRPGRADHDVGARGELTLLAARIHAADAGNHARIGILIEPGEFAMHLKRQFAGRRDDQRQGGGGPLEPLGAIQQVVRKRQAIGDRFARTGLRRNQQIAAGGIVGQHRGLDLRKPIEVAFRQSSGERRMGGQ